MTSQKQRSMRTEPEDSTGPSSGSSPGFHTTDLGRASACPGRGCSHQASFTSSRDSHCPCASPKPPGRRSDSHAPEPQWQCNQMPMEPWVQEANQVVDSGLYLAGITLMNLVGSEVLTTKTGVGQSWRQRMVRVPAVTTRREVGRWSEVGRRGIPASVPSRHCQNKRQIRETTRCAAYIFNPH